MDNRREHPSTEPDQVDAGTAPAEDHAVDVDAEAEVAEAEPPRQEKKRGVAIPVNAGGSVAAIIPRSLTEVAKLAAVIHDSRLAPFGFQSVEQVAVAIMTGAELGLPPMQALQSICVINGKPAIYGDGGIALVRASGLLEIFKEWFTGNAYDDDFTAHCRVKRAGEAVREEAFSVRDAKEAKLWEKKTSKGADTPWVTHKKRMMKWRARSFAFRDTFADVLRGLRFREEIVDDDPGLEIDQNPHRAPRTSGLAARLPGPASNGFQVEHVEREMTVPSGEATVDEVPGTPTGIAQEIAKALEAAKTDAEITVIAESFEAVLATMPKADQDAAAAVVEGKRKGLTKAPEPELPLADKKKRKS